LTRRDCRARTREVDRAAPLNGDGFEVSDWSGGWADVHNRLARSIQLPPDDTKRPLPPKARRAPKREA